MFLVNSRQGYFRCGPACAGQAFLRTYGRFFAEFLNEDSPVRLGVLHQPTCVGLRYGFRILNLEAFLGRLFMEIFSSERENFVNARESN